MALSIPLGVMLALQHNARTNAPQNSIATVASHKQIKIAFEIMLNKESNSKQFGGPGSIAGKNEPTTSSAGAIGIAQIMPETAKYIAKRKGIKWNKKRYREDTAYNRMLGQAYFEDQVNAFRGDFAKAFAAYNAGPGRTRQAIRKATRNNSDWIKYLPKETRHYVRKNMINFKETLEKTVAIKVSSNP